MNEANTVSMASLWLPLILMLVVMYFLIYRPENKRKKQAEEMRSSLKKGDQITTNGGIVGRVVQVTDENVIIETSEDRVRVEIAKWAVVANNSQQPEEKGRKTKDAELPEGGDGK